MSTNQTLVPVLADKVPEFVKELYPRFVQFMRDHIDFLEQDENFLRVLLDWEYNNDPSNQVEPYIDAMLADLGFVSGQDLAVDKHLMLHLLREFYLARGSEASFKFLFRALFNEDVSIQYPRDQLLVPSVASYQVRHYIYTTATSRDSLQFSGLMEYLREYGGIVRGLASGVEAPIENITIQHGSGQVYYAVEIQQPALEFDVNESVLIEAGEFVVSEIVKPILEINVVNGGKGYTSGDTITITGTKLQGQAYVEQASTGGITSLTFHPLGRGFSVGDYIKAYATDGGHGFSAYVTAVGHPSRVTAYKILNPGYKYTTIPRMSAPQNPNDGIYAIINGESTTIGQIEKIAMPAPFVDFTNPTITVSSATGTGAVLQSKVVTRWSSAEWTDRKGVIGENSTLVDSDKYQQYSYTIVSSIASNKYDGFVTELLHPAGYVKTASYEIVSHLEIELDPSDIQQGGTNRIESDAEIELEFTSEFDTDEMVMMITNTGEPLVTDLPSDIVVAD